ncbi:hypothetical protein D3C73_452490 [compost metagenome]
MAGICRQAEDAFRFGCAQPLEIDGQCVAVERVIDAGRLLDRLSLGWRRDIDVGHDAALSQIKPVVIPPDAFLQAGFAAERRAAVGRQGTAAEMGMIDVTIRRLDILAVAGALQNGFGIVLRRQEMGIGVEFIRAVDGARAGHCHRMVVTGAAFRSRQIIPAVALEEMRRLDEAERAAGKDVGDRAFQLLRVSIPFLQQDAIEGRMFRRTAITFRPVVPLHVDEPFAAIVIVKE